MSLVVLTGPVRSGKSGLAEALAAERGGHVVVAVSGWDGDEEMMRRIESHQIVRPSEWETVIADVDPAWLRAVPADAVLVLDCLGTLVSHACFEAIGEAEFAPADAERLVAERVGELLAAIIARHGDTLIVTNEVGWGVVPTWPSARVFRDELGRANRTLVDAADAAYLVVDGRCIDLKTLPAWPHWPAAD